MRPYESAEWQARKFGSLFLMPSHIVIDFTSAREIAECCRVSIQAAEIRFSEVKTIRPKVIAACVQNAVTELTKQGQ
jgi:hypothetical protein